MAGYPANPVLTRRENFRFWSREHVRFSDTDLVGHLNNLSFAAYCETGRVMFLHDVNHGREKRIDSTLPVQVIVNFLGELHWPAEVEVGTGILAIGGSSFRFGQGLFAGERCFGSGETVMVTIDPDTRRSRPIPAWLREQLERYALPAA